MLAVWAPTLGMRANGTRSRDLKSPIVIKHQQSSTDGNCDFLCWISNVYIAEGDKVSDSEI